METRSKVCGLRERLLLLEGKVGILKEQEPSFDAVEALDTLVSSYEPLERLVLKLQACGIDPMDANNLSSLKGLSAEDRGEVKMEILASYNTFVECSNRIETLASQYSNTIDQFLESFRKMVQLDGKYSRTAVITRYGQIMRRYDIAIKRLTKVLEQYALLKYKQSKLIMSINEKE